MWPFPSTPLHSLETRISTLEALVQAQTYLLYQQGCLLSRLTGTELPPPPPPLAPSPPPSRPPSSPWVSARVPVPRHSPRGADSVTTLDRRDRREQEWAAEVKAVPLPEHMKQGPALPPEAPPRISGGFSVPPNAPSPGKTPTPGKS